MANISSDVMCNMVLIILIIRQQKYWQISEMNCVQNSNFMRIKISLPGFDCLAW